MALLHRSCGLGCACLLVVFLVGLDDVFSEHFINAQMSSRG